MRKTRQVMRSVPAVLLVAFMLIMPIAFGQSQAEVSKARAEGRVTIYSSFPVATLRPVLDAFQKAYPGITAEQLYAQTGQAISRIIAEHDAGRKGFDILITAWDPGYINLDNQGILAHYKSPAASSYDSQWFGPNDAWLDIWGGAQVIAYNTSLAKQVPQSWKAMADSNYKGLIALGTPTVRGGTYWLFYHLDKLYGESFFKELHQNDVVLAPGPSAVAEWVASGRAPIGVTTDYAIARQKKRGAAVDWVYPSEGVFIQVRSMALAADPAHPSAAHLFYDWLVGKQGAKAAVAAVGLYSLNPSVDAPPGLPALSSLKVLKTNLQDFATQEDSIVKAATDLLGAQ